MKNSRYLSRDRLEGKKEKKIDLDNELDLTLSYYNLIYLCIFLNFTVHWNLKSKSKVHAQLCYVPFVQVLFRRDRFALFPRRIPPAKPDRDVPFFEKMESQKR